MKTLGYPTLIAIVVSLSLNVFAHAGGASGADACLSKTQVLQQLEDIFSNWEEFTFQFLLEAPDCGSEGFSYSWSAGTLAKASEFQDVLLRRYKLFKGENSQNLKPIDKLVLSFRSEKQLRPKGFFPSEFIQFSSSETLSEDIRERRWPFLSLGPEDFANIYYDPNLIVGGDVLYVDQALMVHPEALFIAVDIIHRLPVEMMSYPGKSMVAIVVFAFTIYGLSEFF